ncbi:hypothetical protein [Alteromonas stellipolaris]|uniref:hypothetical protein n=1 Tax=Alteromonas stellipolaris TaxID=233316 RepID=UPI0027363459|nr:hypothetical protein [Alteromonas stellipolaris]MDP2596398.1 hypothetical protein [Alteromonas stellipolaris]
MMKPSEELEKQVKHAVRMFAISIATNRKVVSDMTPLVEVTSQLSLSNLDYWERLIRGEFAEVMRSSPHPRWKFWGNSPQILTWLDLISWDGYTRERTLRTISGPVPNSFFFALVLRRLNDWVPQVREAAREKILSLVNESDPASVVEALCLTLSHWNSWGRMEQSDKQAILDSISNPRIALSLQSKIVSSSSGPMVTLMSQAIRTSALDDSIHDIARRAVQPSVRAKAYRGLFEGRVVWLEGRKWEWTDKRYCEGKFVPVLGERQLTFRLPFMEVLHRSSEDRSSIVRRVAAEFLIKNLNSLGTDAAMFAERFANDKSGTVSERGRFAISQLGAGK